MYGTVAKTQVDPQQIDALKALAQRMGTAPGQIGRVVYQSDADPSEVWLVALFESRDAYWANAQSPEQHARYGEMRALMTADPEWHDGTIIDVDMSNRNAATVRRLYDEVINQENKATIAEIFAADVTIHDPFTGTTHGVDAFRQLLGMFDTAFPHHRVTVEQVISDGDSVCVLHTHIATHTGPFMGAPATGKSVVVGGLELFHLRDGKIVEFWRKDDNVSLLMQLGMLPMPAGA